MATTLDEEKKTKEIQKLEINNPIKRSWKLTPTNQKTNQRLDGYMR